MLKLISRQSYQLHAKQYYTSHVCCQFYQFVYKHDTDTVLELLDNQRLIYENQYRVIIVKNCAQSIERILCSFRAGCPINVNQI